MLSGRLRRVVIGAKRGYRGNIHALSFGAECLEAGHEAGFCVEMGARETQRWLWVLQNFGMTV